ncbi:hypothetical protein [Mycobacterium sp. ITM-2016-00318]|uniref:hypothetical protein n=1 Tax=Mycobacterium sp. ITM-2016-00318 TaxID=2099693 RepID=UPI000CF9A4EE|nr:hypothetical protein [Mycobacterium sp. ITM-2016-00318]WNG92966.1 hypothetical protein C6A82_000220 [Mycobacterium sp. ITM-2016-00318]
MEETRPNRRPGADTPRIDPGHDYEYDEAHDMQVGPVREMAWLHRVDAPSGVNVGEGGDYGYDEAHDFCARRPTKT